MFSDGLVYRLLHLSHFRYMNREAVFQKPRKSTNSKQKTDVWCSYRKILRHGLVFESHIRWRFVRFPIDRPGS